MDWSTPQNLWFIAGALLVSFEMIVAPGVGFLFAGLSALTIGALIFANLLPASALVVQWSAAFLFTGLWAALLWKPMQRFLHRKTSYHNMFGSPAILVGQLEKNQTGTARWSGTVMKARLHPDTPKRLYPDGTELFITGIEGTTLILAPVAEEEVIPPGQEPSPKKTKEK